MRDGDRPGRVILLNGTSSAGKTTLVRAIQDESETPFAYWGIDTLFTVVPPNWGGGATVSSAVTASGTTAPVATRTGARRGDDLVPTACPRP
ncbi:phosphotransferase-like protein [Saccharothrix xinjiangensis]|uniref:Chloramphenicol phosphotransferase-like protein n=1 Tax=Saccharothrix xinjiangensis TaxID=204798 RepID=A0ABV9YCZ0_9PSEU